MVDLSRVRLSGPLLPYVEGFAAWLTQRGYPPSSVLFHVRRLAYVSRWLAERGVTGGLVDSTVVDVFVGELPADRGLARLRPGAFGPTWEYLRSVGGVAAATPQLPRTALDAVLARYASYLSVERGLVERTVARDVGLARAFLAGRVREGRLDLAGLTAGEVTAFMVAQARQGRRSLPHVAAGLRSLLRFLDVAGLAASGLAAAVPATMRRKLAGLPKALPAEQVAALLASCDRDTAAGCRDFAVLTLLSRLGLRVGEVARLRLEDIDWQRGEITVVGKGDRHERLPLPADVGEAVVAYLARARPATGVRAVFTCARAPYRPMSRGAVTNVAARAARRAGLGTVHGHRLRHSAATGMLDAGASLSEIGQVLRHRHVLTTTIYAKVNVEALRGVARSWPSGAVV